MTNTIQVSPQAQAEMLEILKANDSEIMPAGLFEIICAKYPAEQSTPSLENGTISQDLAQSLKIMLEAVQPHPQ